MKYDKLFYFIIFMVMTFNSSLGATDYYVSPDGNNSDGLSWSTAWQDLQQAIDSVENPAADSIFINLAAHVFITNNTSIFIERSFSDLTISGVSAAETFIQPVVSGLAADRVFEIGFDEKVTLQNLTIRYGHVTYKYEGGGGILNFGDLTILDCAIKENSVLQFGGGIWSDNDLTIERCEISGNYISDEKDFSVGAGIYLEAASGSSLNLNITNTTISGNMAEIVDDTYGIGIYLRTRRYSGFISASLLNCTIADNESLQDDIAGKGLFLDNAGSIEICIVNCIFDNGCQNNYYVYGEGSLNLERCNTICSDESLPLGRDEGNLNLVDPMLNDLSLNNSSNGTFTHNIDVLSPAYNTGKTQGAPALDQRGVERDDTPDIGAYEAADDSPLPVTLSSFTCSYINSAGVLNWTTQSENNNLGWNVYRSQNSGSAGSSIQNNALINGAGTTANQTEYVFTDPETVLPGAAYWYWLESINYSGESEFYGPVCLTVPLNGDGNNPPPLSTQFGLEQNFPNPFNPSTAINFSLPVSSRCELTIYDITGRKIKELFNAEIKAEKLYHVVWDGKDESGRQAGSGIYLYKMKGGSYSYSRKMIMLK